MQLIAKDGEVKVIECNLRASRSLPFSSKVIGTNFIEVATRAMIDPELIPAVEKTVPAGDYVGVKAPMFSFQRLKGADPSLGVEMSSTGEVACFGPDRYDAFLKAMMSTGMKLPKSNILVSIQVRSYVGCPWPRMDLSRLILFRRRKSEMMRQSELSQSSPRWGTLCTELK